MLRPFQARCDVPRKGSIVLPSLSQCHHRIHDGAACGALFRGARGRLERCELWGNANGGVWVCEGGGPTLAACTLRDHTAGRAAGVCVWDDRSVAVGADCVFARNATGDIVRQA